MQEREKEVVGGLVWRSLYFMSLQIGALGSSRSRSYVHGSRSISRLSSDAPYLRLKESKSATANASHLHVSLPVNPPARAHAVSSSGRGSMKRNESHFMSLQTGTLDSRSLAYSSRRPAAKADYYPTATWKVSALGFPSASLLLLGCDWECFRMHAAGW